MDPVSTLAVSALGPVLGVALCAARRRATDADDRRRLASVEAGHEEGDWLEALAGQVPLGCVSPDVAARLGALGLLDDEAVGRARALSGVWRMEPSACPVRWLAVGACAVATALAGAATSSLAACAACAMLTSLATLDLWWRRIDAVPCAAVAAAAAAGSGCPAAVAAAGLAVLAAGLLTSRLAGRGAFGVGDAWLAGALAAVLARCGATSVLPAMLALLAELVAARLALGPRALVPLAPLAVAPAAVAMALGW